MLRSSLTTRHWIAVWRAVDAPASASAGKRSLTMLNAVFFNRNLNLIVAQESQLHAKRKEIGL
jgi:hypothetical protein